MSQILSNGETEPLVVPRLLHDRHDEPPVPGVEPLRLLLLPGRMTVELTQPELVVGRHSSCDVRLPMPDVSRRHCRLIHQAGRWWLLDLRSLNGVFVNGKQVQAKALKPGDRVDIGGFTFLVDPPAELSVVRTEGERAVLRSIAAALRATPQAA